MNRNNVTSKSTVATIVDSYQEPATLVMEFILEEDSEMAEPFREDFDMVDEASWASFPASDPPGWIFSSIHE